jgi:hypothetical protein
MRDSKIFMENHPLKGETIILEKKEYTIGKILIVNESRRLYIEMYKDSKTVNMPLHQVTKSLFDEMQF